MKSVGASRVRLCLGSMALVTIWAGCAIWPPDFQGPESALVGQGSGGPGEVRADSRDVDGSDPAAEIRALILEAETHLGRDRGAEAGELLGRAQSLAEGVGDLRLRAIVRGAFARTDLVAGRREAAATNFIQAIALAEEGAAPSLAGSLGNEYGNALAREIDPRDEEEAAASSDRARLAYQKASQAAERADDFLLEARVNANRARLEAGLGAFEEAKRRREVALTVLGQAPDGLDALNTRVHLAETELVWIEGAAEVHHDDLLAVHTRLQSILDAARLHGEVRLESWTNGLLARLYAQQGHAEDALVLARRAAIGAQSQGDREAELRFQLLAARQLSALGRSEEAIPAFVSALDGIAAIRSALRRPALGEASLLEQSQKASRELVGLLLDRPDSGQGAGGDWSADSASRFELVQSVMERFKADELRDYFRDDCVDAYQERLTGATDTSLGAIVVYPIILEDRTEILVTRGGSIRHLTVEIARSELETAVNEFRFSLENALTRQYLPRSQKLYDLLVRPYEEELNQEPEATLVFVPDGVLRTIPIAALHDGESFLIEKRPVATTPSLELSAPQAIDREHARMLAGGLVESVHGYAALPSVRDEITQIAGLYDANVLIDERFQGEEIVEQVSGVPFNVIHIASHAELLPRAEDSFILTHDGSLSLAELSATLSRTRYRDEPVEIIILSACETAAGDAQAALGLSGMAIRAGARSAVGTLWRVHDIPSSKLMISFHRGLTTPGVSRAEALRQAQVELIQGAEFKHPLYWAGFLLLSNWL